jgi:hypothetical protein
MRTIELPHNEWSRALDEFSAAHEGSPVSLDLLSQALGAQPEILNLPLLGVTAESTSRGTDIMIAAARSADDHITHRIPSATCVRLERTDDGADVALQVEAADGTVAILQFKPATRSERLDGVAG